MPSENVSSLNVIAKSLCFLFCNLDFYSEGPMDKLLLSLLTAVDP